MRLLILLIIAMLSESVFAQESPVIQDGAELTLVAKDFKFTEGPAVDQYGNIYFTDQPNNTILKWNYENNTISTFMENSFRSNGLYFDNDWNLLACADEKNQLIRIDKETNITVLIDNYHGLRLNGPNDLWVDKNDGIYFTDPFYLRRYWEHEEKEIEEERVYYFTPSTREIKVIADDVVKPNGIIGSADGATLFIADAGDSKTYAYAVNEDGSLGERTLRAPLGSDGMTLDGEGNLYLTGNGVTVFDPEGNQIEHIEVPQGWTANVTFGGPDQNILFITAMGAVYTLEMKVQGIR